MYLYMKCNRAGVVFSLQDDSPGSPKKKKDVKKKFKLEPHEDQLFLDGNEVERH